MRRSPWANDEAGTTLVLLSVLSLTGCCSRSGIRTRVEIHGGDRLPATAEMMVRSSGRESSSQTVHGPADLLDDPIANDELREHPALTLVDVEWSSVPLSSSAASFLRDADARIDAFFDERKSARRVGFYPSDYPLAFGVLHELLHMDGHARSFCEWGSGFGVVAGLASMLGFDAQGIEIDRELVKISRDLLETHRLDVEILEGSFIPQEFAERAYVSDQETRTDLSGPGAIDEVDVEIDDFDVIFAFPWPNEEDMFLELFAEFAATGAFFITYHALEEFRVYRKSR